MHWEMPKGPAAWDTERLESLLEREWPQGVRVKVPSLLPLERLDGLSLRRS